MKKYKRTTGEIIADVIIYAVILGLSISIVYPFYFVIINSFNFMLTHYSAMLFPSQLTMQNYVTIFRDDTLLQGFITTAARTVFGTVITVINCALCAFALRKRNLKLRNLYLTLFTIPMFFGGGLIPSYLNYKALGMIDKFWIYIIPSGFAFFYVIIMMSFFNSIGSSLEESATIDGAGYWAILFRIYFPISMPVIATIALFAGVNQWNSWMDTMYFTSSPSLITLPAILMKIVTNANMSDIIPSVVGDMEKYAITTKGIKYATMIVTVVPITLIYPFLQKYFVKGIMVGSIKG